MMDSCLTIYLFSKSKEVMYMYVPGEARCYSCVIEDVFSASHVEFSPPQIENQPLPAMGYERTLTVDSFPVNIRVLR